MSSTAMAMPATIPGSAWAAALSLCGAEAEREEQKAQIDLLLQEVDEVNRRADQLAADAATFEEQIKKKVEDVLSKTPLEIKPRRELPAIGKLKEISTPLIDIDTQQPTMNIQNAEQTTNPQEIQADNQEKLTILGFEVIEQSPSKSPQSIDPNWDLKQTNSMELLTPSPLGYTPFDSRSIDELMTPDEFAADNLAPGLSNVNYDIDLSDFSGDNSIAEDKPEPKDPFSPDGIKKFDPFAPQMSTELSKALEKFDEFSLDCRAKSDPFEVVHKDPFGASNVKDVVQKDPTSSENVKGVHVDLFSPVATNHVVHKDPFSAADVVHKNPSSSENAMEYTDPFSPVVVKKVVHKDASSSESTKTFDPFSPVDVKEVVHRDPSNPVDVKKVVHNDPFSPVTANPVVHNDPSSSENSKKVVHKDPFSPVKEAVFKDDAAEQSILDDSGSPTSACLLPSPLMPQHTGKPG